MLYGHNSTLKMLLRKCCAKCEKITRYYIIFYIFDLHVARHNNTRSTCRNYRYESSYLHSVVSCAYVYTHVVSIEHACIFADHRNFNYSVASPPCSFCIYFSHVPVLLASSIIQCLPTVFLSTCPHPYSKGRFRICLPRIRFSPSLATMKASNYLRKTHMYARHRSFASISCK